MTQAWSVRQGEERRRDEEKSREERTGERRRRGQKSSPHLTLLAHASYFKLVSHTLRSCLALHAHVSLFICLRKNNLFGSIMPDMQANFIFPLSQLFSAYRGDKMCGQLYPLSHLIAPLYDIQNLGSVHFSVIYQASTVYLDFQGLAKHCNFWLLVHHIGFQKHCFKIIPLIVY